MVIRWHRTGRYSKAACLWFISKYGTIITGLKMFISENHTNADTSKFAGFKKQFYAQDRELKLGR